MTKQKMLIIGGPTGAGKSAISVEIAKKIGGEIISCDSMQVYKRMDIGTAKITKEEMQGVPHYLIDVAEPSEAFDVHTFSVMGHEALKKIYENNHIPILVGGTGFYIQSLLYDIDFTDEGCDDKIREDLREYADRYGNHALHEKLKDIDPVSYETIHENNVKRVIRAIEYYEKNHEPISKHNEEEKGRSSPYDFRFFVLTDEREKLYSNIERRIDKMMSDGLLAEVQALYDEGLRQTDVSMQGLSYRQLIDYIEGKCTLDEAISRIKLETRHYAKRQLTWFRREKDAVFINKSEYKDMQEIQDFILENLWKQSRW